MKRSGLALSAVVVALALGALLWTRSCASDSRHADTPRAVAPEPLARERSAPSVPDELVQGLLVASSVAGHGQTARGARLERIVRAGGAWRVEILEDADSNVFHLARCVELGGAPAILTLGGMEAVVKLWRADASGAWRAEEVWRARFGPRSSRMRDAELGLLFGDAPAPGGLVGEVLVIGTHDEGVVALASPRPAAPAGPGGFEITELDRRADTLVHEIELGDLDGDGALEVYAAVSPPNALIAGVEQPGEIVRYVPGAGVGRTLVADLGHRHAKEILVDDVDGDGRDELYVVVEALTRGTADATSIVEPVEIRRYDEDTLGQGVRIATIPDRFTRFLVAGDLDGDARRELVAAAFSTGLWRLVPGREPRAEWSIERLDGDSSGFEHAALLADLDGDEVDELYVADDPSGELRRYTWEGDRAVREVIRSVPAGSAITWSLAPCPRAVLERTP